MPVVAFAHTYGPVDDVVRRAGIARESGMPLWLNRYGYLSDAKLDALARGGPAGVEGRPAVVGGAR